MDNRRDLYSKATIRVMSRKRVDFYMTFVDLTKAFDIRDGLLKIMVKFVFSTLFHSHGAAISWRHVGT